MSSAKRAVDDESDTSVPIRRMRAARHINASTSTTGSSWCPEESRIASCNRSSNPNKKPQTDKKSSILRELESFNAEPLARSIESKNDEAKERRAGIFAQLRAARTPVASASGEHMQERQNSQKRKQSSLLQEMEDYNNPPKPISASNLASLPTSILPPMRGPSRQSAIDASTKMRRQIKADLTADRDLQESDTTLEPLQKRQKIAEPRGPRLRNEHCAVSRQSSRLEIIQSDINCRPRQKRRNSVEPRNLCAKDKVRTASTTTSRQEVTQPDTVSPPRQKHRKVIEPEPQDPCLKDEICTTKKQTTKSEVSCIGNQETIPLAQTRPERKRFDDRLPYCDSCGDDGLRPNQLCYPREGLHNTVCNQFDPRQMYIAISEYDFHNTMLAESSPWQTHVSAGQRQTQMFCDNLGIDQVIIGPGAHSGFTWDVSEHKRLWQDYESLKEIEVVRDRFFTEL